VIGAASFPSTWSPMLEVRVSTGVTISTSKLVPAGISVVRCSAYLDVLVDFVPLDEEPVCFGGVDFVAFGGVVCAL